MKKNRALRNVILVLLPVLIGTVLLSGYILLDSERQYEQGNEHYDRIGEQVRRPRTSALPDSYTAKPRGPQVEIPDIGIDIAALDAVGPDCVGWLYCPDTVIDYPVMWADNYDYYLSRLPDGTKNKNGSLFLDYHCRTDFKDRMSIIYGHKMKSGRMFGSLEGYKTQDYYHEHPYMYLYTREGNYRIDLLYGFVYGARDWGKNGYVHQQNSDALLKFAAENTTFTSSDERRSGQRYITLSTCSYEFNNARYAVIGILRPEYGE